VPHRDREVTHGGGVGFDRRLEQRALEVHQLRIPPDRTGVRPARRSVGVGTGRTPMVTAWRALAG
jgi:hypothetical protein